MRALRDRRLPAFDEIEDGEARFDLRAEPMPLDEIRRRRLLQFCGEESLTSGEHNVRRREARDGEAIHLTE
jgi:hypothetical protein